MRIPPPISRPRSHACALLLALSAACFGGCIFETKVAGGAEDFPNTFASLGVGTSESLTDHAEWDQFANLPSLSLPDSDSLVAGPRLVTSSVAIAAANLAAAKAGTAKTGSAGGGMSQAAQAAPDTTFDLSDTATLGVGRRYILDERPLRTRTDTTVFRWDEAARDSLSGNDLILEMRGAEDWRDSERLTAYRFENLDSAGGFDRAAFHERVPKDRSDDTLQHKLIVVKPGPDGDFDTKADNRPVFFLTARTLGADTLEAYAISDADGDGQLWGDGDSGLVVVRRLQTAPAHRPSVSRVVQVMRAMYHKQPAKSYPVSFREARTDTSGRKAVFSIHGDRADSAFTPGDTVTVTVRTEPGPGEKKRFLEKTNRFRVLLSSTPWQFGQNLLLRFTLDVKWRPDAFPKGGLSASHVTFTPDVPLPPGDTTLAGDIRIEADFADGTAASAKGRLEDGQIEVDLEESRAGLKLRRFRVLWDAAEGKMIRQERLAD